MRTERWNVWGRWSCSRLHRRATEAIRGRATSARRAILTSPSSTASAENRKIAPRSLWEEPEDSSSTLQPAQPSKPQERRKPYRQRYPNSLPTDVLEWLQHNKPQNYNELMDLRRALYARRTTGKYRIRLGGLTSFGEQKMLLTGPASAVIILSDKARHFLLRTLCRLRKSERWPPIRY